jgi:hypothetical protein
MEALIIYLVKVNLLISALFLFYYFLLRKEKFFGLNRFFLLGTLALATFLPLIPPPDNFVQSLRQGSAGVRNFLDLYNSIHIITSPFPAGQTPVVHSGSIPDSIKSLSLIHILIGIYGLITAILLTRSALQILRIIVFIKKGSQQEKDGIIYCGTAQDLPPFSFFNYLVLNESGYDPGQIRQIIAHEKVHIRQGHSLDILFAELLSVILWINPLVLLLKRHLKLNLEYIADESVLDTGIDKKNYQYGILQSATNSTASWSLTNSFNSSKLKLRIKMMNTPSTSNSNLYKYLFVLPLILATYFIITPLSARSLQANGQKIKAEQNAQELKIFEGVYAFVFPNDADTSYIKITVKENTLILTQIWDGQDISFKQTAPLEFFNQEKNFPLKFSKDGKGAITQVLAFNRDLWTKVKTYKKATKAAIHLNHEQLKAFEGVYELQNKDDKAYLQFTATDTGLILKQQWDGKEIAFIPNTEMDFFCGNPSFTLKFSKNGEGMITEVLAFGKDRWVRTGKKAAI